MGIAPENIAMLYFLLKGGYKVNVALLGKNASGLAASDGSPDLTLKDIRLSALDTYGVCWQLVSG